MSECIREWVLQHIESTNAAKAEYMYVYWAGTGHILPTASLEEGWVLLLYAAADIACDA